MTKFIEYVKILPKYFFFIFIVKPIVFIVLGLNIRGRENLIIDKPSIIVANHNSHLDVLVIMSLFPLKKLKMVQPVGALDYFFSSKFKSWFVKFFFDALPISRTGSIAKEHVLEPCERALLNGKTLIIFPEGTRGQPEHLGELHKGVCHLSNKLPQIPITPIFLHGLGKTLPKGETLLVPFFVDVFINPPIYNKTTNNIDQNNKILIDEIKQYFLNNANQLHLYDDHYC